MKEYQVEKIKEFLKSPAAKPKTNPKPKLDVVNTKEMNSPPPLIEAPKVDFTVDTIYDELHMPDGRVKRFNKRAVKVPITKSSDN